jgi:hypothetical protein
LVAASNSGFSPLFPNFSRPQPPASPFSLLKLSTDSATTLSQSYFMTGGLQPISSSWRQAPSASRPDISFATKPLPLCNTLSVERMGLSLMNMLGHFSSASISYIACYENSSLCTAYKSSVSPGFAKQVMSILRILCYNGSLVTTTTQSYVTTDGQSVSLP